MHSKKSHIVFILVISGLFWLISFPLNQWFSETMPRHQALQLPCMLGLGMISGWRYSKFNIIATSRSIAILVFVMSSLIFWMLPHSIDYAVIHPAFNRVMHINMFVAGYLLFPVLRKTLFEIKILFLGMISAMFIATGITLVTYNLLLCSAFTIDQQKETGSLLTIIGLVLFVTTLITFFRGLGKQ
ncbi:MAG: hypothetical protein JST63_06820 [Bacteroidetes bacterium]|nr:hypothetical protein [Bacteroidota bacterium]